MGPLGRTTPPQSVRIEVALPKRLKLHDMKILKITLAIATFIAIGFLGTFERAEQVIYTMDEETYHAIKDSLTFHGRTPSDRQIAKYYLNHQ